MGNSVSYYLRSRGYISDPERDNFCRLCQAIVGVGTPILQDALESFVVPSEIASKLTTYANRKLDQHQRKLVCKASTDGYSSFDITLCYTLIRNLSTYYSDPNTARLESPTRGWGSDPQPGDTNISDDVERIRLLRNKIYHNLCQPVLEAAQYLDLWQEFMGVCIRMKLRLNRDYPGELQKIETYRVNDATWKEMIQHLLRCRESDKQHEEHERKISELQDKQREQDERQNLMEQTVQNEIQPKLQSLESAKLELKATTQRQEDILRTTQSTVTSHSSKIKRMNQNLQSQTRKLESTAKSLENHKGRLEATEMQIHVQQDILNDHEHKIKGFEANMMNAGQNINDISEEDISRFNKLLYEYNYSETQRVQVSPLQRTSKLPIDLVYAPVVIREDLEYKHKCGKVVTNMESDNESKLVNEPDDMFTIDNNPARYVFMRGDAAYGKTVFCMQLLKHWCTAKKADTSLRKGPWERGLGKYDYLFFVSLRHVRRHHSSLVDMICKDMFNKHPEFNDTIRYILSSGKFQCLIVVDGLDEWKYSPEVGIELEHQGFPNTDNCSTSTILVTSRPWKFDVVADIIRDCDRVVEIRGLDEKGVEVVIENVLSNYYKLDKESKGYKSSFTAISEKSKNLKLKSAMQIPLLATATVQLLHEKKEVGESMTGYYISLLRLLVKRAIQMKSVIPPSTSDIDISSLNIRIPDRVQEDSLLNELSPLLLRLGEIAYHDLISGEKHLIFEKERLEKKLGREDLEFALKVGLLSQCEAPGCFDENNVSVNFFHKSVQEFLAAFYVASTKEGGKNLLKELAGLQGIMDLANVLIFVSGLEPLLGSDISKHIVTLSDNDKDVQFWRRTFDAEAHFKIQGLFTLHVTCYKEMLKANSKSTSPVENLEYYVADAFLNRESDKDTIRISADILQKHCSRIASIFFVAIKDDKDNGITEDDFNIFLERASSLKSLAMMGRTLSTINSRFSALKALELYSITFTRDALFELQKYLTSNAALETLGLINIKSEEVKEKAENAAPSPHSGILHVLQDCNNLTTLYISYMVEKENREILTKVLPQLKKITWFWYVGSATNKDSMDEAYDDAVVKIVCGRPHVQKLDLSNISFKDSTVEILPEMRELDRLFLVYFEMTPENWKKFYDSLLKVRQELSVKIWNSNIDEESLNLFRFSEFYTVTLEDDVASRYDFTKKQFHD